MKTTSRMLVTALALGVTAWAASAQEQNQGDPPRRGNRPPPGEGRGPVGPGGPGVQGQRPMMVAPLFAALDANHDGVIDEKEIENASKALKTLDKNNDGKITPDEIRPPRLEGMPGPGDDRGPRGPVGPGGPGRRGGPGGPGGRGPGGPPPGDAPERPSRPAPEQ